jgi:hypothetical protein
MSTSKLIPETNYEDFTERSFEDIIGLLKAKYVFSSFHNPPKTPHLFWRHDVDFSVHRAYRLSVIEKENDVLGTYLFLPNSTFYNMQSRHIVDLICKIKDNGHDIGLHFDPSFYQDITSSEKLEERISQAAQSFEWTTGIKPTLISFHLYGEFQHLMPKQDFVCGMLNIYSQSIFDKYSYVSDSNGVWRHRSLPEVAKASQEDYLHILTHPEWWSPTPMSPRARIQRCIDGYAEFIGRDYDELIARFGRPNVGKI